MYSNIEIVFPICHMNGKHIETHCQSPGFEPVSLVVYHDIYGRASNVLQYGARSRDRTGMPLRTEDFKSSMYTISSPGLTLYILLYFLLIDSAIFFLCPEPLVLPTLLFIAQAFSYPYFSTLLSQGVLCVLNSLPSIIILS